MRKNKLAIADSREGGRLTLQLSGRLDTETAPQLQQFLDGALADTAELRLDMEELAYVSSAGLRVLLAVAKRMDRSDGTMVVEHVNREIREVFAITGFDEILTLENCQ